jgi:hypothetical protein
MTAAPLLVEDTPNPIDKIEHLASRHDWFVDRPADDEVNIIVAGGWSDLHVSINWREDLEGLHIACSFDLKVPANRRGEVARLVTLINEQLYFGHFDQWATEGTLLFRNGLLLTGGAQATEAQCEALIDLALDACERYFPAFQFVIWAGKSADDAMRSCLIETMGEA